MRDAILSRLHKDRTCQLVTDADLSSITHQLDLVNQRVMSLKEGDFEGLFNVSVLNLENNDLTTLPSGVFDGLISLRILDVRDNELNELPPDLFDGLAGLSELLLDGNELGGFRRRSSVDWPAWSCCVWTATP